MKRVVSIPGVFEGADDISLYSNGLEKRTVAMVTNNNKIPRYLEEEKNGLNWDLTTFPSYPEQMNVYPSVEANSLILNVASKHKEEAFKVIEYLVSEEVQIALAKSLQMSALKGEQFTKAFGENYPALKTKNLQGMFKGRPAPLKPTTIYDDLGLKAARDAYKEVTVNNKDINTALREANEKLNQAIAAEKAK
jgi:multiple sugar transport system substrate-binding protein